MLNEDEAVLYDRQVRALGTSKQQHFSISAVVIELVDYLLEELAKTCVILGFRTVICIGKQRSKGFDLQTLNSYCSVQIVSDPSMALDALAEATAQNRIESVYLFLTSTTPYLLMRNFALSSSNPPKLFFLSFAQKDAREFQIATDKAPDDTYALNAYYEIEDMYFLGDLTTYFLFALMDADEAVAPAVKTCTFKYSGVAWSVTYS